MRKTKKAVIFGTASFAEIAHFYLTRDSEYEAVAFTATRDYIRNPSLFGLPLVSFDSVESLYVPAEHEMFIAVGYVHLNRTRETFYHEAKRKGYRLLTYVSSKATVWSHDIGDNCFVLEDNTIQPFVKIGNNVVMWSGNHIGHHSTIQDHCFLSSHVVISGHVQVGPYCFIGVNAAIRENICLGESCIIGAGALIMKSTKDREVYIGKRTRPVSRNSDESGF